MTIVRTLAGAALLFLAATPAMAGAPPAIAPQAGAMPGALLPPVHMMQPIARIGAAILSLQRSPSPFAGGATGFGKGMVSLVSLGDGLRLAAGGRRLRRRKLDYDTATGASLAAVPVGAAPGFGRFQKVAPALALGYADSGMRGVSVGLEANALFAARPRLSSLVADALAAGATDGIRAGLSDPRGSAHIVPVVRLSLGYRF